MVDPTTVKPGDRLVVCAQYGNNYNSSLYGRPFVVEEVSRRMALGYVELPYAVQYGWHVKRNFPDHVYIALPWDELERKEDA